MYSRLLSCANASCRGPAAAGSPATIAPDTGAATGNLYVIGADASVCTTLANSNDATDTGNGAIWSAGEITFNVHLRYSLLR